MFKLLILIGLGVAAYFIYKTVFAEDSTLTDAQPYQGQAQKSSTLDA
jgi:hypothetical protein